VNLSKIISTLRQVKHSI